MPTASHIALGRLGEEEACLHLLMEGYVLLDRNWRSGHLEIDIVAEYHGEIVFVEVKTRRDCTLVDAELAVDGRKIQSVSIAANSYIKRFNINALIRFDVITVVGSPSGAYRINHIEDAFLPIPVYRR